MIIYTTSQSTNIKAPSDSAVFPPSPPFLVCAFVAYVHTPPVVMRSALRHARKKSLMLPPSIAFSLTPPTKLGTAITAKRSGSPVTNNTEMPCMYIQIDPALTPSISSLEPAGECAMAAHKKESAILAPCGQLSRPVTAPKCVLSPKPSLVQNAVCPAQRLQRGNSADHQLSAASDKALRPTLPIHLGLHPRCA